MNFHILKKLIFGSLGRFGCRRHQGCTRTSRAEENGHAGIKPKSLLTVPQVL